jgi:hypothetical protein
MSASTSTEDVQPNGSSPPAEPAAPTPDHPGGDRSAPTKAMAVLGSVVAPAALISALMYVFGLVHAYWFFQRFGVDYTIMRLTTQDYLLRSQDGLFVPLVAVAAAGLALLWTWALVPRRLVGWAAPFVLRRLAPVCLVGGLALLACALVGLVAPHLTVNLLGLPGSALAAGVLLMTAASRLRRRPAEAVTRTRLGLPFPLAVAEWAAVFLLVSVGLFWAVSDNAAGVGTMRANQVIEGLAAAPDVTVLSERSLNLVLPGVDEQRCGDPEGGYGFRYRGLKLVVQSGGQLLLLPQTWIDRDGPAVVLPWTDAVRLEFSPPGTAREASC